MTIILFLIDTSASMNARTYLGARPTLLDVSKDAVEKFLKVSRSLGGKKKSGKTFLASTLMLIHSMWSSGLHNGLRSPIIALKQFD